VLSLSQEKGAVLNTITDDLNIGDANPSRTDRLGKVFLVLNKVERQCLVCEKVFKQQQAAEHSKVWCYPALHGA
jgi:hypothetical protein